MAVEYDLLTICLLNSGGIGVPKRCTTAVAYYQKAAKAVVDSWEGNPVVEQR